MTGHPRCLLCGVTFVTAAAYLVHGCVQRRRHPSLAPAASVEPVTPGSAVPPMGRPRHLHIVTGGVT